MKRTFCSLLSFLLVAALCTPAMAVYPSDDTERSDNGETLRYYQTEIDGNTARREFVVRLNYEPLDLGQPLYDFTVDGIPHDFQSGWVPLRLLCEYLGYSVVWDDDTRQIYINSPGVPLEKPSVLNQERVNVYVDNHIFSVSKVMLQGRYYAECEGLMRALGIEYVWRSSYSGTCDMFMLQPLTESEKVSSPPLRDSYGDGLYRVGVDIPAGWFELTTETYTIPASEDGCIVNEEYTDYLEGYFSYTSFHPSKRPAGSGEKNEGYNTFKESYIIHLEEGAYFELKGCAAQPYKIESPQTNGDQYSSGTYRIGVDIPAGEYVMMRDQDMDSARYLLVENLSLARWGRSSQNDSSCPQKPTLIYLTNGLIELENCTLYPSDRAPDIMGDGLALESGIYKVGLQIPAGIYTVTQLPDNESRGSAHFCEVSDGPRSGRTYWKYQDVTENPVEIEVKNGEYLYLSGCTANFKGAA